MFSVSPEMYRLLFQGAHWLFSFLALSLLLLALSWLLSERRKRRDRFRSLPEAGTVGEMVVISGTEQLPVDTWFPVPREGILGSLRSCDLVVPAPGVRSRHLSFSWQDGTGLTVRPFRGCEAYVDGVPLLGAPKADLPVMVHGSCLQVGSAVLRLQLLSALEHTNRPFTPAAPPPETVPMPEAVPFFEDYTNPAPGPIDHTPQAPAPDTAIPAQPPERSAPRRRRADRWKEDFSE